MNQAINRRYPQVAFPKPKIAVSDCLLGTECRYNGGHAQYDFVRYKLADYVEFKRFCPEAAVIGTPRETVRLVGVDGQIRVMGPKSGSDYTDGLQDYTDKKMRFFHQQEIDGAVVKSRSPSCGLERIKVYRPTGEWFGSQDPMDAGLFTKNLRREFPMIAIEEEGRLQDAWLRENFMLHIFSAARWREFVHGDPSVADFQAFHRDHKYLLLSKNEGLYRKMGPIVAEAGTANLAESLQRYGELFLQAVGTSTSRGKMVNTIEHMYGYFKDQLGESEKEFYQQTLAEFKLGIVPLVSVMKLIEQWIHHFGSDYLATQKIIHPYPAELALRSSVNAYRDFKKK
ncbi:DUF523 and DUF1722 domain-containing protein [Thiomicrorhabdus sp. 6S3-12]|uniref:YbgA family protein n=1 Tax=Thiomicrorhabdus sp. 6S3-12 TaxID=2819681 RepID=UPI001AACCAE4|nr:DUF523 and DUF1722 domain-containing protein [Thiomicrorhabdus sp. 6S3-12]MBO1923179.1 DUF523 and DUF1722 domain-containing protein [Thiomicrorhabdus sp. 6S3-12]